MSKFKSALLMLLVFISSLVFTVNPAYAETYQVINVMVAYDEEWQSVALWNYGYKHPDAFCCMFIEEVSWRFEEAFGIKFSALRYVFWDSNDSLTEDVEDLLYECIDETGFYIGMMFNGEPIDILIAFSDQHNVQKDVGIGKHDLGACLVIELYSFLSRTQYTDNILQHELTHLYEEDDECFHHWTCPKLPGYDCIMNMWEIYIASELKSRPYCFTTTKWNNTLTAILTERKAKWGREVTEHTGGTPGFFVPEGEDEIEL